MELKVPNMEARSAEASPMITLWKPEEDHLGVLKKCSYHRREKPGGGKDRRSDEVKESGTITIKGKQR
jgi:hypothetical protein